MYTDHLMLSEGVRSVTAGASEEMEIRDGKVSHESGFAEKVRIGTLRQTFVRQGWISMHCLHSTAY